MVFVTVGNAMQGFLRFLKGVDALAEKNFFNEEVFMQTGNNSGFLPKHCMYKSFVSMDEFQQYMERASLIICHGGCTQLQAVRMGKTPIVMPRRKKYGEHVNDHQVQLVQALASERLIVPAYDVEDLPAAVTEARKLNFATSSVQPSHMTELVEAAMKELVNQS